MQLQRKFLAKKSDLRPGELHIVEVEGQIYALYQIEEHYYLIEAVCPHQGASLAEYGSFTPEGKLLCRLHIRKFEPTTGRCLRQGEKALAFHPLIEDAGNFYLGQTEV